MINVRFDHEDDIQEKELQLVCINAAPTPPVFECPPCCRVSRLRRAKVLAHSRRTDGGYLGMSIGTGENWLIFEKLVGLIFEHIKRLG